MDDPAFELLQQGVELLQEEHADLSTQWSNLDSKAQATASIAGIFVAAILTFVRELSASAALEERLALNVAVILLTTCILLAVLALRIREVDSRPSEEIMKMITDLVDSGEESSSQYLRTFANTHANAWKQVNADIYKSVRVKANYTFAAQASLFAAAMFAAIVAIPRIWAS